MLLKESHAEDGFHFEFRSNVFDRCVVVAEGHHGRGDRTDAAHLLKSKIHARMMPQPAAWNDSFACRAVVQQFVNAHGDRAVRGAQFAAVLPLL